MSAKKTIKKTRMTPVIKAKLKKSDDQTNINLKFEIDRTILKCLK